jgi:hypothetical protein
MGLAFACCAMCGPRVGTAVWLLWNQFPAVGVAVRVRTSCC